MTQGIVDYSDLKDGGKELLRKPTIDDALPTLDGDPLTIGHIPTSVADTSEYENGKIDKWGFDPETGWHFCEGTVETEQARKAIRDGWGISIGTRVLEFGPGGQWLNNRYDREIKRLKFHHLALVEPGLKPRFEDAAIRLNSTTHTSMFKWIRTLAGKAGEQKTEQASDLTPDTKLDLGNGKSATLKELVDAERANHCHAVAAEDYIEADGVRYHCGTLISNFKEKANAVHHVPTPERANAETPKEKAEREVNEAKSALDLAKTALATADEAAARPNATEADKTAAKTAKTAFEEATTKSNEAGDRLNAINPPAAKVEVPVVAAKVETPAAKPDELVLTPAERERVNSERKAGLTSFAILAQASEKGGRTTFVAPKSGIEAKRALGRKLAGSDRAIGAGKN